MINRIRDFIVNQGISVSAFEQNISASDGMIRRAIKNGTDIQSKWITKISENYPNLNLEWLITGKGSMLKSINSYTIENDKKISLHEPEHTYYVKQDITDLKTPSKLELISCITRLIEANTITLEKIASIAADNNNALTKILNVLDEENID